VSAIAETIKGINILIGSDTTGLSKALSDVNKNARDIQSELKQVEKLLKLDPTNTELLAQKQKLLGDAVANSREKLDRLRAVQEQVNQQFARGDISEGQYRAFQREVAATEQELRRLQDRLEETGRASNNLGETLEKAGDKMKGAGEKMSLAITAPIVAAGGVMLKGAIDAENAQAKLQASLGATAEEAEELGGIAESVWKNGFGENIEEVNGALVTVKQNMLLAGEPLRKFTEGAMTLADVFGVDVKESTAAARVMVENFGISGQDALDLITVGFQQGGDFSGELLDTLREYSPQFASMGMSADQMLGILISGAQAGAWNLDKVGDAVKEFNIRAQDGSKTTADGFAAIGLNADQMGQAIAQGGEKGQQAFTATIAALAAMTDPVAQNTAGVALFGTQWEDVRSKVIAAMADGVKGIGDFKGATEEAAKAAYDNNPGLALTMAMREIQAAIGPALLPLADIITNTVVPAIKSLAEWFKNLSPEGQKVVLVIAGIAAAIGPVLVVIGSMATGFSSVTGVIGKLAPKLASLVLGMGPVGIAIAAVVAAGILLYKNWDTITAKAQELRAKLGEVWGTIKNKASEVWESITDFLSKTWEEIKETVSRVWVSIKDFFKKWGDEILLIATGPVGWAVLLGRKIAENWDHIKQTALNIWNSIKTGISNIWTQITSATSGAVANLYNTVKSELENVWSYIKSIPSQAKQWGLDIIKRLIEGIKSLHIPTPHFSFSVGYKNLAGINLPVPNADINWYAKGGIFTSPQFVGIGDVPEAVMPLAKLPALMTDALIGAVQRLGSVSGDPTINLIFPGPITIRSEEDIVQVSNRLGGLVRSAQRGAGRR